MEYQELSARTRLPEEAVMRMYANRYLDRVMWSLVGVMTLALIEGQATGQCQTGPQTIVEFLLDTDPGWSTPDQWAFGIPAGITGDPTGGWTGVNVYGYNLNGNYPNDMIETVYLTTGAIDLTGVVSTTVEFQRWLGVEVNVFDHANFQVSTDGKNWTTVWEHNSSTINQTSWRLYSYDISALVDFQSTVYLRWGMGPTDFAVNYFGWNIDDIRLIGIQTSAPCPGDANDSGDVTVTDLLDLLAAWGPCAPPCPFDSDCSGNVNVTDLLVLLAAWGPCSVEESGSCMRPNGSCVITSQSNCLAQSGQGWSAGSSCLDSDSDRLPDVYELNDCSAMIGVFAGTSPLNPDTDGDGIIDGDEVLGTSAGLDLRLMGADPLRLTMFVEIDWMNDALVFSHSHRPTDSMIDTIVAAYANAPVPNTCGPDGITLIVDYGQSGMFTGGNFLGNDTVVVFTSEFNVYKSANFNADRSGIFRYSIFCHRYNDPNNNSSGVAEINGDDFIVSLQTNLSLSNVTKTFLHEIGHNLGLRHGGFENRNYKPNYNSVMNYRYQFAGIDTDCNAVGNGVLDYSTGFSLSLDESSLDESHGICGTAPIDWNLNGIIDSPAFISHNINCPVGQAGICGSQPGSCYDSSCDVLQDFNDWLNLNVPIPAANIFKPIPEQIVTCLDTPEVP